ncbi:hypothetical protein G6O69_03995 [Pseudenhygromyxa sp. WMMC2535]|uniref:hypothetical protein n=1 Tax=Pseudenhygromyxa sp. WMMC2535 TaxID=2712867 RepID=UPI0015556049|nr:hypothetical protein [Pseudenhygromyxa sp. WMMC2535]NVB36978.1 hypothetical protein [Pseudenhygromyxa sp. WMMC2535]
MPVAGPDAPEVKILAHNAGFEIVASADRAWCFDRRTRGPGIAAAVSGGLAGVLFVNAAVALVLALGGGAIGPWWLPLLEAGLGVIAGLVCKFSLNLRQARFACERAKLRPLVVVDRHAGLAYDADGQALARTDEIPARKGMLIDSSAPALRLLLPSGKRVEVFRGSLFGGGIEAGLEALRELGFAK